VTTLNPLLYLVILRFNPQKWGKIRQKTASANDEQRREQMKAGIALCTQKMDEAGEGEAKAGEKLSHRVTRNRAGWRD
jgi:hypothetical protein